MDQYQTPRQLREKAGVSEIEMAERLGISQADLGVLEGTQLAFWELGALRDYLSKIGYGVTIGAVRGDRSLVEVV